MQSLTLSPQFAALLAYNTNGPSHDRYKSATTRKIVLQVTILLCGPLRLEYDVHPIVVARQKALGLMAYLAVAREPVSRDELASLLWPELSQERARAALRTALPALTTAVPIPWIAADRRVVQLDARAVVIDLVRFYGLIADVRRHGHQRPTECTQCAAWLHEAATLYRGEFLQGFTLAANPEFETWQLAQREALRQEAAWVLRMLADPSTALVGDRDERALRYGRRWLEIDPPNEAAHRALMELYGAAGRRSDVLKQFSACAALLQTELGVAPAPETIALYERFARSAAEPVHAPVQPRRPLFGRLPAEPGGFIGREAELAWLTERLRDPACRLVTLTGPGGIGKTRLALRAAALIEIHFADGARLAPLGDARSSTEALRHIAAAVEPGIASNDPPLAALQRVLAPRNLLLVLDNLEHLRELAEDILHLLAAAPGLTILATSRERLALRAEHVLPLDGLAVPATPSDAVGAFGAVQLFLQRAQQVRPDFHLSHANQAAIVQICTLVEGMPLAIELAAAWMRSFSPAEIAAEIARSPDFLRATVRDLPERHRSLRAVFLHSWQLLNRAEQVAFQRLAVFRGGFTIAAAMHVAELELDTLVALEDKSLLRRDAAGRYDFHPLLREYAAERMAETPAEAEAVQERHARYIAGVVAQLEPLLSSGDHLATFALDSANIRVAWFWAIHTGTIQTLGTMVEGLARFCELRSYRQEAEGALAYAEARLTTMGLTDPAELRVLAHIQAWRGHFCQFLGRYDESMATLERCRAIAQQLEDPALLAFCAKAQGINANAHGEHRRAIELHQASLQLYTELNDPAGIGEVYNRMGGAAYDMGDLPEARRCWQASLTAYTELDDLCGIARALNNLGEVARMLGDHEESRRLSEASLAYAPALGPGWSVSPYNNLGLLARIAGRYAEARRLHEQSLAACREVGDLRGAANTIFFLGELELAVERLDEAATALNAGLEQFRALRQRQGISACLIGLAELAIKQGAHQKAVALANEGLALAEAIAARLTAARARSALGLALALGGDQAAGAAALEQAEETFIALGARTDAAIVAQRRERVRV
jgi:predicted ATPase/DNA-binding SARP family transcriptional activator